MKTFTKTATITETQEHSHTIDFYRVTVKDMSGICTNKLAEELLECFQNGILEWKLNRLRAEHKRLVTRVEYIGNDVTILFTKKHFWEKK